MKLKSAGKLMFILVGLLVIYGSDQNKVAADEGCDTSAWCSANSSSGKCNCGDTQSCKGCFIATGESGCGKCSGGGGGDIEIQ